MGSKPRKQMTQIDVEQVTGSPEETPLEPGPMQDQTPPPAPTPKVPHVYQAIRNVIVALSKEGIAKDKKNTEQNFVFRSIDAFLAALSVELPRAGLVILPRVVDREVIRTETPDKKITTTVYLEMEYTLVSTVDGTGHVVKFCGEGRDRADKAANKATSGAYKYMAIQTFCVPVVGQEDADFENPEEGGAEQEEPARKRAPRVESPAPAKDRQRPAAPTGNTSTVANPIEVKLEALIRNEVDREKVRGKLLDAYGVMVIADIPADRQEEAIGKVVAFVAAQQARKRD